MSILLQNKIHFPKKLTTFLMFWFSFGVLVLIASTLMWLYMHIEVYVAKKSAMQTYSKQHISDLQNQVFDQLFNEAEQCPLNDNKLECIDAIKYRLAVIIKEEELAVKNGYDWPHDLIFVKQTPEGFYSLGWDGNVRNITSKVDQSQINHKLPNVFRLISHNCLTFRAFTIDRPFCEIFTDIPLAENEKGFMVRMMPLTEEYDWTFIPYIPLFAISQIFWGYPDIFKVITDFILIICLPLIGAFKITKKVKA